MKKRNLLVILLLFFNHHTFAYQPTDAELHQNSALCSYGYNLNCGFGSNNSYSSQEHQPDRYGAISVGMLQGVPQYFTTSNEYLESGAKTKALMQCIQAGADKCKLAVDYSNQCVAAVKGTKNEPYTTYFGFGLTPDLAMFESFQKCRNDNNNPITQCHLFIKAECSVY